jgi:hypothetical protein
MNCWNASTVTCSFRADTVRVFEADARPLMSEVSAAVAAARLERCLGLLIGELGTFIDARS